VVGLFIAGLIGMVLVLYAVDRILKARAQARRLRRMSDRLAAATARAEEQHEERQAVARASAALTTYLPAIKRPPLPRHGVASPRAPGQRTGRERTGPQGREHTGPQGREHTGPQERGSAHAGRRPSRTRQRHTGR
jgi:hypothetical protein